MTYAETASERQAIGSGLLFHGINQVSECVQYKLMQLHQNSLFQLILSARFLFYRSVCRLFKKEKVF